MSTATDLGAKTVAPGAHILYIDDEEPLVLLATRLLKRLGYRVTAHVDATLALADFTSRPHDFHAAISDVSMPKLSGLDLARRLLQLRPDFPVLLTSGCVCAEDSDRAARIGVRGVVQKPTGIDEFTAVLREFLAAMPA